jgi:hypothetical protein
MQAHSNDESQKPVSSLGNLGVSIAGVNPQLSLYSNSRGIDGSLTVQTVVDPTSLLGSTNKLLHNSPTESNKYRSLLNDLEAEQHLNDRRNEEAQKIIVSVPNGILSLSGNPTSSHQKNFILQDHLQCQSDVGTSLYVQSSLGNPMSPNANSTGSNSPTSGDDCAKKREMRLFKNREAARECRRKKKEYVRCLENRVAVLETQNKSLIEELRSLKEHYQNKEQLYSRNDGPDSNNVQSKDIYTHDGSIS